MSLKTAYDEKELLTRVSRDDQGAFSILVNVYSNKVFSHALTFTKSYEEAEELVQDVFLKVWNNRKRLTEIEQFKNYLFILSRNLLISSIRKKVMDTNSIVNLDIAEALLVPDKQFDYKETYQTILNGIHRLPPQQKNVFTLSRIEQLSYEEISIRLGISKSTVKFHLVLALNFLREFLYSGDAPKVLLAVLYAAFFTL